MGKCALSGVALLLIPLAYGVLHLAMRSERATRMSLGIEIGLMVTIWAIINFTAFNLYLTWTGGGGH